MDFDRSACRFEALAPHHDREAFDCGTASLNDFLKKVARQNADRNVGVTTVLVPEPGSATILGYYTLVMRTVSREIGVVLLGRLAVDQAAQGQGIGRLLLLRAIDRVEVASREMGIYALVLDAVDEAARRWYLHLGFGFQELADSPNHLCLPVETIRRLREG